MDGPERINEEQLLDHLLEQCDQAEAARITAALEDDPRLSAAYRRLANALQPLDAWTTPEPPQRMVAQILDGIAAQNPPKLVPATSTPPATMGGASVRRPLVSLRELVALAACITIFVGVFVPTMRVARFNSRRQLCASNLRSVYHGMSSYAAANAGFLPFAGPPAGQRFPAQAGRRRVSNRNHLYPLAKQGYIPRGKLHIFLCPGRKGDRPMSPDQVETCDGFADPANCSYDVQHMSKPIRRLRRLKLPLPLLGDANPFFEGGRSRRDTNLEVANSISHRRVGQNLLLRNGVVIWQTTPVFKRTGDNVYQAGKVRDGSEAPTCATDTYLIP